jgi:hypothetical protein
MADGGMMPYAPACGSDGRAVHAAGKSARGIATRAPKKIGGNKKDVNYQPVELTAATPPSGT